MPIQTDLAGPSDIPAMAKMSRDEVERGLVWRYRPERILALLRTPDTTGVCVRFQKRDGHRVLLGFGIMRLGSEDAHIILLAVDRLFRRRGVGSNIMEWLEKTAQVAGMRRILLEVRQNNGEAKRFYERFGFVQQRRLIGYYATQSGTTEDGLGFVKSLH